MLERIFMKPRDREASTLFFFNKKPFYKKVWLRKSEKQAKNEEKGQAKLNKRARNKKVS